MKPLPQKQNSMALIKWPFKLQLHITYVRQYTIIINVILVSIGDAHGCVPDSFPSLIKVKHSPAQNIAKGKIHCNYRSKQDM